MMKRLLLAAPFAGWVALHAARALACGASAPPYYVVEQTLPSSDDAPLNTPLSVTLRASGEASGADSLNPSLVLTKRGDDRAISVKAVGSAPTLAWVPAQSLEPGTTYEAHYEPGYAGVSGTVWQFTTGDESAAPLSLEGELQISLESGEEPAVVCPPSCVGCGCADLCRSGSTEPVVRARVKLPRAVGGFARRFGVLWLTDDRPYDFTEPSKSAPEPYRGRDVSLAAYAELDDPNVTELVLTLPLEDKPYKPCFAFQAADLRDDRALASTVCLDEPFPSQADQAPADADTTENAGDLPSSNEPNSGACSFGRDVSGGSSALGFLLALTPFIRRRRAR